MTTLAAYFDESHSNARGIYVVAGYIGHLTAFDNELRPAWKAALARAPKKVQEFKASHLSHGQVEFDGWDLKKEAMPFYKDVVSTLCTVLPSTPIFGVAAAIVYPPNLRHEAHSLADPGFDLSGYDCCLSFALRTTLEMAGVLFRQHPDKPNQTLRIFYDRRKEPLFARAIKRRFAYTQSHIQPPQGTCIHDPHPQDSHEVEALQAADLLAFETHMEVRSLIEGGTRKVRKSLELMVKSGLHIATCIDIETLARANIARIGPELLNAPTLFRSDEGWRSDSHWRPGRNALSKEADTLLNMAAASALARRLGLFPSKLL